MTSLGSPLLASSDRVRPYRQPFVLPAAAADGSSIQTADGPPSGYVDMISAAFPTAPLGAQFTMSISGVKVGSWSGPTPYGPLLVVNNETIEIDAARLVTGQSYVGVLAGTRQPAGMVLPSTPLFSPSSVLTQFTETLVATIAAGTEYTFVTLPAGTQALRIFAPQVNSVQGNVTGKLYGPIVQGITYGIWTVEVDGAVDSVVLIDLGLGGSGTTSYVVASQAPIVVTAISPSTTGGGASPYWDTVGGINGLGQSYPFLVDRNGRQVPLGPTATATRLTTGQILAAPAGLYANYLFGFQIAGNVVGGYLVTITDGGTLSAVIGGDNTAGANSFAVEIDLHAYRTTSAVSINVFGAALTAGNLFYAVVP